MASRSQTRGPRVAYWTEVIGGRRNWNLPAHETHFRALYEDAKKANQHGKKDQDEDRKQLHAVKLDPLTDMEPENGTQRRALLPFAGSKNTSVASAPHATNQEAPGITTSEDSSSDLRVTPKPGLPPEGQPSRSRQAQTEEVSDTKTSTPTYEETAAELLGKVRALKSSEAEKFYGDLLKVGSSREGGGTNKDNF